MAKVCWADTETYCETPIRDGTYIYASSAEIMLFTYALGDGPVKLWDLTKGEPMPADLKAAYEDEECVFVFHNSMFDRNVLRFSGVMDLPIRRVYDTMVQAMSHSLPGALAMLCQIFRIGEEDAKISDGKRLIQLFCKPRPKTQLIRRATYETHPEEWEAFCAYAISDISAMRAVHYKMPKWNYSKGELALWRLDQQINDRGFAVDRALADSAVEAIASASARNAADTSGKTGGVVERVTQRDKLLRHILFVHGVALPDLKKATLERRLHDQALPKEVRELIALRLDGAKASTAKYKTLLKGVNDDDRLRGTLQFNGAMRTGRWAGRLFQPQNLTRPTKGAKEVAAMAEILRDGNIELVTNEVMDVCSNSIRGCIVAPPGKKLVVSDLSNIEGRFAAWVAREEWKCAAFSDFDNGIGEDLYKVAYGKAFDVDPSTATGDKRQIGKVMELMLQYEGGVGAFLTGAASYGIDLDDMAERAMPNIPERIKMEAFKFYNYCLVNPKRFSTHGLEVNTFVACDSLKRMWREAHPAITGTWKALKEKITLAILEPGTQYTVGRLLVRVDGAWLKIQLPSGRLLCYPSPRVDESGSITYMGVDPYTRQWRRLNSYGGKFFENICQAGSRDVMAYNMQPAEDAGYLNLLTVHDELITEAPDDDDHTEEGLSAILATNPPWAKGLPLAAGGYAEYRYRKD